MRPRVSMSEVHSYSHALQQQQQQQLEQADADEAAAALSPAERHVLDKATASYPRRIPSPLESPILPSNMQRHIGSSSSSSSNSMPSPEDAPTHWNQPNYHHSHHPSQQQQQQSFNQTIPRHTLTHSRPVNIITPRYSPYSGHRRSVDVNDRLASFEQRLNCSVAIVASSPPYSNLGQTHLERRSMPQIGSSSSSPLENTRMRGYSNPQPVHSHSHQYAQPVRTLSIPSSAISHYHPSLVHHPIQSAQSAQSAQPYPQQNTHSYASSQRIQQQPQYVQPSFVYATATPQNHSMGPVRPQQHQPYDSHHQQQQQQQRPSIILPASHHYPQQQQPYVLVQSEPMYIASQEGYPVYSNPSQQQKQQQQQLESGRTFQCDQCDLTFTRKHDMNRHIRSVHAPQQPFLKGPGGVNLLDSPACVAHEIVDTLIPVDRLLCEVVPPSIVATTAARPPPFVVRVSLPAVPTPSSGPSISPQPNHLQSSGHATAESTDKTIHNRYPCTFSECGKVFKTAWHRSSHMKLHTTIRDFPCSQCAMTFARRHDVLRHERTVHNRATVKDITCRCGKTFGRLDSLKRHQKMICVLTR
ncbi:hypothetical protein CcCBS67573_g09667 [Chytriomyces confervae]|uniref:C2H2-type domain-containing protein n=1 Tax=Chytriomyces confervae TaxID=246404 RepID=A0A507DR42_9FUNG|nr:hypothetical protein CcCBS67573_g09667 [Chytriomyces confervae]